MSQRTTTTTGGGFPGETGHRVGESINGEASVGGETVKTSSSKEISIPIHRVPVAETTQTITKTSTSTSEVDPPNSFGGHTTVGNNGMAPRGDPSRNPSSSTLGGNSTVETKTSTTGDKSSGDRTSAVGTNTSNSQGSHHQGGDTFYDAVKNFFSADISLANRDQGANKMPISVFQVEGGLMIKMDIPGVSEKEIVVTLQGRTCSVTARRDNSPTLSLSSIPFQEQILLQEGWTGTSQRAFCLPLWSNPDSLKVVSFERGVMEMCVKNMESGDTLPPRRVVPVGVV